MKICEVSPGHIPIPPEGAGAVEKIVFALSTELGRLGHEVHIVDVSTRARLDPPQNVFFRRVPNLPIPNRGISHLIRGIYFMFASTYLVARLVGRQEIDIIHVHNQFSGFLILILNRFWWRKPLVFTTHNQEIFDSGLRRRVSSWPERYILKNAESVVCVSPTVKRLLMSAFGLDPRRLVQIYSGVHIEASTPRAEKARKDGAFKIITVARIVARKNQLMVVEAAREVAKALPRARFLFIGPVDAPAYLERMNKLARDYGLEGNIDFPGEISAEELDAAYADADLFVLTSTNENQGLVILEAMARSVPVICSGIGPFVDMLSCEKDAATIVDDAAELAAAIVQLLGDPVRREQQIAAAKKLTARFAWDRIAREYAELFAALLSSKRDSRSFA